VHYNSSRTGVRLIGPEAGLGPTRWRGGRSATPLNIHHDNAYAIGAIDFTGDARIPGLTVRLCHCPATVAG
jgi:hypothetical protein